MARLEFPSKAALRGASGMRNLDVGIAMDTRETFMYVAPAGWVIVPAESALVDAADVSATVDDTFVLTYALLDY